MKLLVLAFYAQYGVGAERLWVYGRTVTAYRTRPVHSWRLYCVEVFYETICTDKD